MSWLTNPREKKRRAEKFKAGAFWRQVMLPAIDEAIAQHKELLVDCEDEEIADNRANIRAMRMIKALPDEIIDTCKDDIAILEAEEALKEQEETEEE